MSGNSLVVERDTEALIDNKLTNLGWCLDPHAANRNVYMQRVKTESQKALLAGKRPDYTLYPTGSDQPLAIIEAKKPGQKIGDAIQQGVEYAKRINAPIVFATDGIFTKSFHINTQTPLLLNGEEVDELLRETMALKYIYTNEVTTLNKKVLQSRSDLISIFEVVNNILREEGLQQGLERFTEFSNLLFLKVLSEIEDIKEISGEESKIDVAYRWDSFKKKTGSELISYVNDTVLKWFSKEYRDENIFQPLQVSHPDNLKAIIDLLDGLQLTDVNADIKGDAFEYFIRSYSASNPSDLGEIFTPRHIVKTVVKLVNPQIGETVYDPFCGTGGMLTVAFKHLLDTMPRSLYNIDLLKHHTIYGADITKTSSIAKMNMILAGDGHNNIVRRDSLANPVDDAYDVVITNMPFAQKTRYGDKYTIPSRNGDIICPQHCWRAVKPGGRMAIIVPDGFLTTYNNSSFIKVREFLIKNATLKSVVSLPRGSFEPYNRVKASILYFTDIKKATPYKSFWYFDIKNDGFTLDKKRRRIPGPNDLEQVLSENDLENQSEDYRLSLGIDSVKISDVLKNNSVLISAPYRVISSTEKLPSGMIVLKDILEPSPTERIGSGKAPIMSITMNFGLIDQGDKFKKRIASADISGYKKVYRNELVIGFPIDEGVLGFQLKYEYAAVSPAYSIWRLKPGVNINIHFLDILLRSYRMREIYRSVMQGAVDRRRSIPKEVFLNLPIPVPSIAIQEKIVSEQEKIEEARKSISDCEASIQEAINAF